LVWRQRESGGTGMHYGLTLPLSGIDGDVGRLIEFAHIAEEEGWEGVFLEDYIVYWGSRNSPTYDPWLTLAAIALRTQQVRIGITVTPLSRRRSWKLARESITLDHLSHGRLILGFGLGDEQDSSFTCFGEVTDVHRRAELLDEGLEILAGLMSGQPFHYQGKHSHVNEITFAPRPIQTPRIPIWIGGFWPRKAPARRAARWDGFCPARLPDEHGSGDIKPSDIRDIKAYIARYRSSSAPFDLVVGGHTPGDDPAKARAHVEQFIEAGATWWSEFVLPGPGEADRALTRIKQGAPRV
jgi:alkanesulfonate monooxygenase SsuD/methylene tetrahydromethanopterin reductase-like flavin-dependent oxidoreductase (luciferase family)